MCNAKILKYKKFLTCISHGLIDFISTTFENLLSFALMKMKIFAIASNNSQKYLTVMWNVFLLKYIHSNSNMPPSVQCTCQFILIHIGFLIEIDHQFEYL